MKHWVNGVEVDLPLDIEAVMLAEEQVEADKKASKPQVVVQDLAKDFAAIRVALRQKNLVSDNEFEAAKLATVAGAEVEKP